MNLQEFQKRYTYDLNADKLGEGGFGSVFKAYDTHRDRWVALKISKINPQYESTRLRKEVEMVAKLPSHPNIAYYEECYTFRQMDGEYDFGVLQYYEEGNLSQLLNGRDAMNRVSTEQKTAILTQILEGIDFLHQNGVIHRDLKPQNILIVKRSSGFIPKITDFGISKQLDTNKSSVFSNSLAGAGTLAYASPEQLGEREIRKNTDLWSFGIIAWQMFTGNLPFTTGEHASTSEAGRIELFRQINLGKLPQEIYMIPEPWRTLIRSCLTTDPSVRIKSAQEAKQILNADSVEPKIIKTKVETEKQKTHDDRVQQTPKTPETPKTPIIDDPIDVGGSSRKYLLGIILAVVLLLAAGAGYFIFRGKSSNEIGNFASNTVSNMTITRPDGIQFIYTGRILDSLPVGKGKAVYPNGDKYEGSFLDGYREGKGKMTFADKSVYEGDYEKDNAEGRGELRYTSGERYVGQWKDNFQNGSGTFYDAKGNVSFRGTWLNGEAQQGSVK